MDVSEDEINLLLPLTLFVVIAFVAAVFGGIIWFLNKKKIIKLAEGNQLFSVFRAAIFSIVGVFAISSLVGVADFIIQIIKNFISK